MTPQQQHFVNRIRELAQTSQMQSRFLFTGFLNEAEYSDVLSLGPDAGRFTADGGHEGAQRVMVRFGDPDEFGYDVPFPIAVLRAAPLTEKFAEQLTHRDYLGALLSLGIERKVIGDILIEHPEAYIFCEDTMAEYICSNLSQVRHTSVRLTRVESVPEIISARTKEREIQISSGRLDAVIAHVYNLSRSASQELFRTSQVYLNGRAAQNPAAQLHDGDVISVRHQGKFRYCGEVRTTRKGKLCARIEQFV